MKSSILKHLFLATMCVSVITIVTSCSKATEETPNVQIEISTINLTSSNTKKATVIFTVNTSWKLMTSDTRAIPAWFTTDQTSGEAGTHTLTIEITEENPSGTDNRTGYIHIIAGSAKSSITIIQPPRNNIAVESISINKTSLKLAVNETETLTITFTPENTSDKLLVWKSDNPAIATVDDTGKVKGISNGKATITVTTRNGDKSAQCLVIIGNSGNMFDNEDNPNIDGSSEEKAYEIATADQLLLLSNRVISREADKWNKKFYKLTKDIDMSLICGEDKGSWQPIGGAIDYTVYSFDGVFDGCGMTIKSLYYNIDQANYRTQGGLFGVVGGIVKNITLESPKVYGDSYCGAIAGVTGNNQNSTAIIKGCTINDGTIKCNVGAGGIVGAAKGAIIDCCISKCEIVASTRLCGGITGDLSYQWKEGVVKNCKVTNSKISSSGHSVGGIVGWCSGANIYASAVVDSKISGLRAVGGIVGYATVQNEEYTTTAGCYANNIILTANDTTQGVANENKGLGGIVGCLNNWSSILGYKIYSCYISNSTIESPVSYNSGYIAGANKRLQDTEGHLSIDACYYHNIDGMNIVNKAIGFIYNDALANTNEITENLWGDIGKGSIKDMNDKLDDLSNKGYDIEYRYTINKNTNLPILIKSNK